MSELMVLERTSRVHDNGALRDQEGPEEFRSAISGSMRQSGAVQGAQSTSDQGAFPSDQAEVYAQGYLDGLRAAGLHDAGPPVADPAPLMTGGGGSLVGGLGPDAMGLYPADPYAMRSPEVGAPFGMQGMGPGVPDELAGAILFLERMMQLLAMLANQFPGGSQSGGMQYPDMMTPGGPGFDPRGNPEMSIMPVGNDAGSVTGDLSAPDGLPVSGGRDINPTVYKREVNEAIRSGAGSIPLITETPPSEEGYGAGPFSGDELNEILDYATRDPAAMREALIGELSGQDAPNNVVEALEALLNLLEAGDVDGFRNAFLNLERTDIGDFLAWGAMDVANAVRREEEGGAPSNPALDDLDGNIADGLPIDMNASEDLATEELATEDMLEEEAA